MSGCDYLPSINRMGLKSVIKHYSKHGSFAQVMKFLRSSKSFKDKIPPNYEEAVKLVKTHFRHQTVFDPYNKTLTSLTPLKRGAKLVLEGKSINPEDLDFYSQGMVNKKTGEIRQPFSVNIDKIREAMNKGSVSLWTFEYLADQVHFREDRVPDRDEEDYKDD